MIKKLKKEFKHSFQYEYKISFVNEAETENKMKLCRIIVSQIFVQTHVQTKNLETSHYLIALQYQLLLTYAIHYNQYQFNGTISVHLMMLRPYIQNLIHTSKELKVIHSCDTQFAILFYCFCVLSLINFRYSLSSCDQHVEIYYYIIYLCISLSWVFF